MKLRIQFVCFLVFLLIAQLSGRVSSAQDTPLQGFDDYVNKALADWRIPGLAIAIVKDDKVVFAKGYGVRRLGDPMPVNERTMFAIGSPTKAFTATALAMLVDEGKIKWDDPVTKHLKDFQLYDPYVTREITVRDLLCHRSGLDRGDELWNGSTLDRDEILRRFRYQKPAWGFRSHFGYNNIMYLAAGQIISAVTGKTWDAFVKERIFTPLGMTSTGTTLTALKNFENVANPHTRTPEEVRSIPWRNSDNAGPFGSIYSDVVDMAQWLRLQLGEGSYQDQKLVSIGSVDEMQQPQMIIPLEGAALSAPQAHFLSYGFGWFLQDYHGVKVVRHGGNINGMVSMVGMLPEEKLGVVILSNMDTNELPTALLFRVFDSYLGLPSQDWSTRILTILRIGEARQKAEAKRAEEARVKNTKPTLALAQYIGTYRNDMYGEARVTEAPQANGQVKLLLHYSDSYRGEMEHWHYDTFHLKWEGPGMGDTFVTFTLNAQGQIDAMKVQKFDEFKRVPEGASAVE